MTVVVNTQKKKQKKKNFLNQCREHYFANSVFSVAIFQIFFFCGHVPVYQLAKKLIDANTK